MIGLNTAIAGIASIAAGAAGYTALPPDSAWSDDARHDHHGRACLHRLHFVPYFWMWFRRSAAAPFAHGAFHPFRISNQHLPPRRTGVVWCWASTPPCFPSVSLPVRGFSCWKHRLHAIRHHSGTLSHSLPSRSLPRATKAPPIHYRDGDTKTGLRYIWLVPTATAVVLVVRWSKQAALPFFPGLRKPDRYPEADAHCSQLRSALVTSLQRSRSVCSATRCRTVVTCCAPASAWWGTAFTPLFAQNWHLMAGPVLPVGMLPRSIGGLLAHLLVFLVPESIRQRRLRAVLRHRHGVGAAGHRYRYWICSARPVSAGRSPRSSALIWCCRLAGYVQDPYRVTAPGSASHDAWQVWKLYELATPPRCELPWCM